MQCPKCSSSDHRALITNSQLADQTVRRRRCLACGHRWFTVEVTVPDYAVGWSAAHMGKPVLRVPVEVQTGHTQLRAGHVEAKDQLAPLRERSARWAAEADARHRIVTPRKPPAA